MLKNRYINIMGHKIALLLFIFMFTGNSHIKASNFNELNSGLSVNRLLCNVLQEKQNQQEFNSFQYTNSSRDLSDLFDKTDSTTVRQVDPTKVQLKNLISFKDSYNLWNVTHQPDLYLSFKPQLSQSISLFIFNRNILI